MMKKGQCSKKIESYSMKLIEWLIHIIFGKVKILNGIKLDNYICRVAI